MKDLDERLAEAGERGQAVTLATERRVGLGSRLVVGGEPVDSAHAAGKQPKLDAVTECGEGDTRGHGAVDERHDGAVAGVAGVARLLGSDELATDNGVNAVSGDEQVGPRVDSVFQQSGDALAVLGKSDAGNRGLDVLRTSRSQEDLVQVGAVNADGGNAELAGDGADVNVAEDFSVSGLAAGDVRRPSRAAVLHH